MISMKNWKNIIFWIKNYSMENPQITSLTMFKAIYPLTNKRSNPNISTPYLCINASLQKNFMTFQKGTKLLFIKETLKTHTSFRVLPAMFLVMIPKTPLKHRDLHTLKQWVWMPTESLNWKVKESTLVQAAITCITE